MTRTELEERLRQLGLLEHQLRDAMPLVDQYYSEAQISGLALAHYCVEDGSPEEGRINNAIKALEVENALNSTGGKDE